MSPILVRPVREQLEHDRLIRLLHTKFRRKYDAGMNPGNEQNSPVGVAPTVLYPDLVLLSADRGRRLQVVVEVETGESVNHLEALAQWAHFGKLRASFHLYVPAGMVDVARRLCEDNHIHVGEIWSYHIVGDQPRFTLVYRSKEAPPAVRTKPVPKPPAPKPPVPKPPAPKAPVPKAPVKPAPRPAAAPRKAKPVRPPKPARAVKKAVKKKKR